MEPEYLSLHSVFFIYDSLENGTYENFILTLPDNVFPIRKRELTKAVIDKIKDSKIIIYGGFLALSLIPLFKKENLELIISESEKSLFDSSIKTHFNNDTKKANITMNIVMNALDRNFEVTHDHKIR